MRYDPIAFTGYYTPVPVFLPVPSYIGLVTCFFSGSLTTSRTIKVVPFRVGW